MRFNPLLLATLGLSLVPCVTSAHDHEPLKPGARVRLAAPALGRSPLVGTITFVDRDSLKFRRSGQDSTSWSMGRGELTRAWVSEGRRSNLLRGALIGAGVGVIVGLVVATIDETTPEDFPGIILESSGAKYVAGVIVFGGSGLVLGGAIGLAIPSDKWREVRVGARVGSNGDPGRATPTITVAFGF